MDQRYKVSDLPQFERPRERLQALGVEALSVQELLAVLLGSGRKGESVMMLAQKVVACFGSVQKLAETSLEELQSISGIGSAKACQLKACFELGRRCYLESNRQRSHQEPGREGSRTGQKSGNMIFTPKEVYETVIPKLFHAHKEHFIVMSFDSRQRLLGMDTISVGTLNTSLVHPREVFDAAIARHAASIIAVHNHPSGDVEPSEDDRQITKRLAEAGRIMGIELMDHVIVTKTGFASLKERGVM